MRVLIAGDLHANYNAAKRLVAASELVDPDYIFQVGDFGYWPRHEHNAHFLRILEGAEKMTFFADGNHEDHAALESADVAPGFSLVAKKIYHARRGTTLELDDGTRTLFFGGARSVDRTYRIAGESWFAEELPTEEQWRLAHDAEDIDYVIAHEVPHFVDFGYPDHYHPNNPWPGIDTLVSENVRKRMAGLAAHLQPVIWFGGHHHVRKTVEEPVRTEVLNCDGYDGTFVLLDTQTGDVRDVRV